MYPSTSNVRHPLAPSIAAGEPEVIVSQFRAPSRPTARAITALAATTALTATTSADDVTALAAGAVCAVLVVVVGIVIALRPPRG